MKLHIFSDLHVEFELLTVQKIPQIQMTYPRLLKEVGDITTRNF
jgi:hypothetical protein